MMRTRGDRENQQIQPHPGLFDDISVQLVVDDDSTALDAALRLASHNGGVKSARMSIPSLGSEHRQAEIDEVLAKPMDLELPCMIMTADARLGHRAARPPIQHVNGSARVVTRRQ